MKNTFVLILVLLLTINLLKAQNTWDYPKSSTGTISAEGTTFKYLALDKIHLENQNNVVSHKGYMTKEEHASGLYGGITYDRRKFVLDMKTKVFPEVFSPSRLKEIIEDQNTNILMSINFFTNPNGSGEVLEVSYSFYKTSKLTVTELAKLEKALKTHIKFANLKHGYPANRAYVPITHNDGISWFYKSWRKDIGG
jgi:hypothetical protein